ncbi:MAG: polymorphic toxin-type HINT domain-containing protein [Pirellulales bacterium]
MSRAEFVRDASGQLVYRHLIYREGQEEIETSLHQTNYPLAVLGPEPRRQSTRQNSRNRIPTQNERREMLDLARLRDATLKAASVESSVAQKNLSSKERNDRVCAVLSEATGVSLPADPQDWWQWWTDYNGRYDSGEKLVRQTRSYDSVQYNDPYRFVRESTPQPRRSPARTSSSSDRPRARIGGECLQAGTLVWTEAGHVPIEQIKVGDLVLSQHPDTGQLAYQPVLNTTVRPPTGVIHIRAGDETLCTSGGHPFWVVGQGWLFARDITAPMLLHTLVGTAAVDDAEPIGVDEFYNIEVADFHTFFVTKSNILTHDLTTREATNFVVPGLVKD